MFHSNRTPLLRLLSRLNVPLGSRKISTSPRVMTQEWQQYGVAGSNLPFCIKNKYKLTAAFALFFSSGFSAPFLIARRAIILANTKEEPAPPQQLTTIVCFDEE